jgi:hypothetical protein
MATWAAGPSRSEDPVVVSGSLLPTLLGRTITQIFVFRYDAGTNGFVPIPYQIDQRIDYLVNPGSPTPVHELIYDVFHQDDGKLDADDEIAFLDADAGDAATANAQWPPGVDPDRFEIRIADPRPGGPYPDRFVYIFTGTGLVQSTTSYVNWNTSPISPISSARFGLGFVDRWLMTGYQVFPPCGTGEQLVDRIKGRAGISPTQAESEEIWNSVSFYLGGLIGPVRAIRYVRGAASGVNTMMHDIVYRGFWERTVNLRVHALSGIWFYVDLLPKPGTTFYSSTVRSGVPVDGVNDSSVGTTIPAWSIMNGPGGGVAILYTVPPSPFVGSELFYYRDDASYDDQPANEPDYTDKDDSAYGDHGIHLDTITSSESDTIPVSARLYPLCSNQGDPSLGDSYRQFLDYPLQLSMTDQTRAASAVRTLMMTKSGADLALGWQPVAGATSYRIYASASSSLSRDSWTLIGTSTIPGFIDTGALANGVARYYSVTAVTANGEGPW